MFLYQNKTLLHFVLDMYVKQLMHCALRESSIASSVHCCQSNICKVLGHKSVEGLKEKITNEGHSTMDEIYMKETYDISIPGDMKTFCGIQQGNSSDPNDSIASSSSSSEGES